MIKNHFKINPIVWEVIKCILKKTTINFKISFEFVVLWKKNVYFKIVFLRQYSKGFVVT